MASFVVLNIQGSVEVKTVTVTRLTYSDGTYSEQTETSTKTESLKQAETTERHQKHFRLSLWQNMHLKENTVGGRKLDHLAMNSTIAVAFNSHMRLFFSINL